MTLQIGKAYRLPNGEEVRLSNKEFGLIRMASRKCGMSYRAACNRSSERANDLKKRGYLRIVDTGRELGQFIFRTTQLGNDVLAATVKETTHDE